jgi:hypothetical protein
VLISAAIAIAVTFATRAGAAPRAAAVVHPAAAPRADTLRVVVVVDDTAARRSLIRGSIIGAEEASRTGVLFDQPVSMTVIDRAAFDSIAGARSSGTHPAALAPSIYVVAGDSALCSRFLHQKTAPEVPVLDVGCPRTTAPAPATYGIDPRPIVGASGDSTHLELWHASLERFGAEQLNQRFRRRFDAPMDSGAWAGWFALKVALDLALHAHSASPSALLAQLADPHASFDGQKGRPLRFAADTHRLVQPLYRVSGSGDSSRVLGEVAP